MAISSLLKIFAKQSNAPEWYVEARRNRASDAEVRATIRAELVAQAKAHRYDPKIWNEEFIEKVTDLYQRFFEQLYSTK